MPPDFVQLLTLSHANLQAKYVVVVVVSQHPAGGVVIGTLRRYWPILYPQSIVRIV